MTPRVREAVGVVADNSETLDGMHSYLQRAGVTSSGTRSLSEVEALASEASALIIFPDEFHTVTISSLVRELLLERPRLFVILVTATPHLFQFARAAEPHAVMVLPKPAFGWTILDALRDRSTD
jgi:DNA-binding NtrC family response regulator